MTGWAWFWMGLSFVEAFTLIYWLWDYAGHLENCRTPRKPVDGPKEGR
jgi:hypothetical protein